MPPTNEVCGVRGLYPFMISASASYKESPLLVVFVLLRQVPSQINNCNSNSVVQLEMLVRTYLHNQTRDCFA